MAFTVNQRCATVPFLARPAAGHCIFVPVESEMSPMCVMPRWASASWMCASSRAKFGCGRSDCRHGGLSCQAVNMAGTAVMGMSRERPVG